MSALIAWTSLIFNWALSGPLCSIRSGHASFVHRGLDALSPKNPISAFAISYKRTECQTKTMVLN